MSKCRANLNIHTSIAHFEMKKTIVFLNRRKINRYSMKIINSLIQSSHIMGNGNKSCVQIPRAYGKNFVQGN